MFGPGQLVRNTKTDKCAKIIDPWDNKFEDDDGNVFEDNIADYTHIEDEFGRPAWPNDKARKYAKLSKEELLKMRKRSLKEWEQKILSIMDGNSGDEDDKPSMYVSHPFANNGYCDLMETYFLRNRGAKPLYTYYHPIYERIVESNEMVFTYKGKTWIYDGTSLMMVSKIAKGLI